MILKAETRAYWSTTNQNDSKWSQRRRDVNLIWDQIAFDLRSNRVWFDFKLTSGWQGLHQTEVIQYDPESRDAGCLIYFESKWSEMIAQATRCQLDLRSNHVWFEIKLTRGRPSLLQIRVIQNDSENRVAGWLIYSESNWSEMIAQATQCQLDLESSDVWQTKSTSDQKRSEMISKTGMRAGWSTPNQIDLKWSHRLRGGCGLVDLLQIK